MEEASHKPKVQAAVETPDKQTYLKTSPLPCPICRTSSETVKTKEASSSSRLQQGPISYPNQQPMQTNKAKSIRSTLMTKTTLHLQDSTKIHSRTTPSSKRTNCSKLHLTTIIDQAIITRQRGRLCCRAIRSSVEAVKTLARRKNKNKWPASIRTTSCWISTIVVNNSSLLSESSTRDKSRTISSSSAWAGELPDNPIGLWRRWTMTTIGILRQTNKCWSAQPSSRKPT